MSVKIIRRGVIHLIAFCDTCGWDDAWSGGPRSQDAVRQAAKRHTKTTGYAVTVESGTSTTFELDADTKN